MDLHAHEQKGWLLPDASPVNAGVQQVPRRVNGGARVPVSELQGVLQAEWSQFRLRIDDLLRWQSSRQEAILAECLGGISPAQQQVVSYQASCCPDAVLSSGTNSDVTQVDESRPPSARGPRASRLRELSTNIRQISPPRRSRDRGGGSRGTRSESLGLTIDSERREVSRAAPPSLSNTSLSTADAALGSMQVTVAQLTGTVQRVEKMLLKQEERAAERLQARQNWRSELSRPALCYSRTFSSNPIGEETSQANTEDTSPKWSPKGGQVGRKSVTELMESTRSYASKKWLRVVLEKRFSSCFDWWETLEVPQPTGRLADVTRSKMFELSCAFVIIVNAIFTWYTTNYEIRHLDESSNDLIDGIERFFVTFYLVELGLKLVVHRQYFFCNSDMQWNIFDFSLIVLAIIDQVMTALSKSSGTTDMTFMRVLRILKMAKILRGLRVMRFFLELRLMLNSLIGSMQSLMWSIVMLLLIFYVFGLVFVQGAAVHLLLHQKDMEQVEVDRILNEFGSVERAMLALYRSCTGGEDWTYFYDIIMTTGRPYAGLFIFFIAFSQIAFLNILTAIFVNQAMELAKPDRDTLAVLQRKKEIEAYEELRSFCRLMDEDGTGTISVADFEKHLKSGRLGARLSILGLNVPDAAYFFDLLLHSANSEAQEVSCTDFVEGCMRMRGMATGIDLQSVDRTTRLVSKSVRTLQKDMSEKFDHLAQAIHTVLCDTSDLPAEDTAGGKPVLKI